MKKNLFDKKEIKEDEYQEPFLPGVVDASEEPPVRTVIAGDKPDPAFASTIGCPPHPFNSLDIQTDEKNDKRRFAICNCNIEDNQWKGKVVWEYTVDDNGVPEAGSAFSARGTVGGENG